IIPLPAGETPVGVYMVDSSQRWRQIAGFLLRVQSPTPISIDTSGSGTTSGGITAGGATGDATTGNAPAGSGGASSGSAAAGTGVAATTGDGSSPSVSQPPAGQGAQKQGSDHSIVTPGLTVGMKSQVMETHFPDSNRPPRSTFADLTLQG